MARKKTSRAAAKKKVARKPSSKRGAISSKRGEICFPAEQSLSPTQIKVFNLKKGRKELTVDELCEILKEASRSKVGYVVLNAPFKLSQASQLLLPSSD